MMSNKALKGLVVLVGICAVGAVGYIAGRYQAPPTVDPTAASPAESPPATPAPHTAQAVTAPVHGSGAPKNFAKFNVGNSNVKALLTDGSVTWIGTSSGLIRYDSKGDKHIRYDNRTGLVSNGIFHLNKLDDEIWVGTYGGGLSILNTESKDWRNYNIPNGMGDAFVYDVLQTRSGDIWIATWSGANRIVGGDLDSIKSWELYTVDNTSGGLPNDWVYGLAEGKSGEIWMATEGGLARFDNGTWTNWNHADGLGAPYEAVAEDIQYQNDPGQYSSHHARQKKEQGLGDIKVAYNPNYIVSLAVDNDGTVWAGTWGAGLSRFDGKKWRTYTTRDGLPGNHVFALAGGANGDVWIGTSSGLAKHDGTNFTKFGEMDGLFSNTVFSIDVAKDGDIWVGGFGGVTWFPKGIGKHGQAQ
jgi:ligand-binding sensor domain-containing protein